MPALVFTASGPDPLALARALGAWDGFSAVPEKVVLDSRTEKKGTADWLEVAQKAKSKARVVWSDKTRTYLTLFPRDPKLAMSGMIADYSLTPSTVLGAFAAVPFEIGVLLPLWDDMHKDHRAPSFGDNHGLLGWGCMFKGAGHDRLVSRRWLEFGPWHVHRGPNDTSLVQFHSLSASLAQAIEQARPGHERMGISKTGGFIQTDYVYHHKPDGLYQPKDRSLRILINGRDVSQIEMLDAAAYRHYHRKVADQPIESVRFIYVEGEARARKDLHELWLRGLECWTIVDGAEKRLDADYQPKPSPPAWAAP